MKSKVRNCSTLTVLMILTLVTACMAQDKSGGGRLAGTWDTEVSITDCVTGNVTSEFKSTGSFHQGGTFSGITAGMPLTARSPEIGVWQHESANQYRLRFKAYLFNPAGVAVAYQIITHTVVLNADNLNYTSAGDAKIFALNGTQIGAGCSSAVGTRMVLD